MKRLLMLVLSFGLFAGVAFAHNGMIHVMGTVTAMTDTNITVKTMDGKSQTVALNGDTKYVKGNNPTNLKAIKVGDHVVIHTTKKGDQVTASEVKVGAMKGMQGMHGDMNGMKMDGGKAHPQQ
jgi:hypothetical protein